MAPQVDAPSDVPVQQTPLSAAQRQWLECAVSYIDADCMRLCNCTITSIHNSPTGEDRTVSEWMVQHMCEMGLEAFYQPIDEQSGNAVGRLYGSGAGPSLLLYAPYGYSLPPEWQGFGELDVSQIPNLVKVIRAL